MESISNKIILVVDDGGIHYSGYNKGYRVNFDSYIRVLELAQEFALTIPISVCACFLDVDNISGKANIGDNTDKIIAFLKDHSRYIPIWNHGLTHRYNNRLSEFYIYKPEQKVPEEIQREHLVLSQEIFKKIGLETPDVFVPPGHSWEPNVTDKLAKEVGIKTIAITQAIKKSLGDWIRNPRDPYEITWENSRYLNTIYRMGLGIKCAKRKFDLLDYFKMRQYIHPANKVIKFLTQRSTQNNIPIHHYYAHIQNFVDVKSLKIWKLIMRDLLKWKKI